MAEGVVLRPNHFGQEVRRLFGLAGKMYSEPVEPGEAALPHSIEMGEGRFLELLGDGEVYSLRTHVPNIRAIEHLYDELGLEGLPRELASLRDQPDVFLLKNLTPSHLVRYGDQRIVGSHPPISDEDAAISSENLGPAVRDSLDKLVRRYPTGGRGEDMLMSSESPPIVISSTGAKYSVATAGYAPVQKIYLFRGITFPTVKALAGK